MRDLAKGKEERYKEECKNYYDGNAKERKFDVDDLVLVRKPGSKLQGFSQLLSGP